MRNPLIVVAAAVIGSSAPSSPLRSSVGICLAFSSPTLLPNRANVRFAASRTGTPPPRDDRASTVRRCRIYLLLLGLSSSPDEHNEESAGAAQPSSFPPVPVRSHHVCVKTRSMEMALAFYSLLGYSPEAKFRAGPARAAWLTNADPEGEEGYDDTMGAAARVPSRIEIIEVPAEILDENAKAGEEGGVKRHKRAADRFSNMALLGLDHLCLDVTGAVLTSRRQQLENESKSDNDDDDTESSSYGLSEWMDDLQLASQDKFGKTLRVALEPRVKRIGQHLIEMAFIYDADGSLLELINCDVYLTAGGDATGGSEGEESSWDDEDDGRIVWKAS